MKKLITLLSLAIPLSLVTLPARALDAGIDYQTVSPIQSTANKQQVEVLEFFWYRCPHCFHLEPELKSWSKKLPKNVVLRRVPGILSDGWIHLAKAYYALEAMGLIERMHDEVFKAIHTQGVDLNNPTAFFDWAATKGIDKRKLESAYNSFGVNSKVMQAQHLTRAYKLTGVPAFAINGKYTTSATLTGSNAKTFEVIDALIAQEQKSKGGKR
jgi:thiol:disulfide interchange protein DsbA